MALAPPRLREFEGLLALLWRERLVAGDTVEDFVAGEFLRLEQEADDAQRSLLHTQLRRPQPSFILPTRSQHARFHPSAVPCQS
jgi:hypothetical protein